MKSARLFLFGVLPFCIAALLSAQTATPQAQCTRTDRDAEILELQHDLDDISARLSILEAEEHHAVPRGMGTQKSTCSVLSAVAPIVGAPRPVPTEASPAVTAEDAPILSFFRGTTINLMSMAATATTSTIGRTKQGSW